MSAIAVGIQKETVKDMVIAGYQMPKVVRFMQIILYLEANLNLYLKHVKTIQINFKICKVFRFSQFFTVVIVLVLMKKWKPTEILVMPNVVKVSQVVSK
jgi:hypothetical protein